MGHAAAQGDRDVAVVRGLTLVHPEAAGLFCRGRKVIEVLSVDVRGVQRDEADRGHQKSGEQVGGLHATDGSIGSVLAATWKSA